ncbi:MAG TPA: LptA/OstA family protein [Devosia sp.]|jgi:lipopolysaccharide export system protein LptA
MIRPFAALFALLLLAGAPALAQQAVNITADQFTVDEKTKQAVFTGNVVVVHPSVTVHAGKVEAVYGQGASDIQSFVATGDVVLDTPDQKATGDRAVFNPGDQLLRLTGNVKVTNPSGTVDSGELVVNLATNVSTFTSTGNGRVTGVFTSQ